MAWMFMPPIVVATPAKDRIAIVQEIRRRGVVWKGIAKLLRRPVRCRMVGDGHVDNPSTPARG
jgi:hypothetical protein